MQSGHSPMAIYLKKFRNTLKSLLKAVEEKYHQSYMEEYIYDAKKTGFYKSSYGEK